jgi:AraC-like DNA-binding protein
MLTGLTDPQIASALRAFHADIRRSWSVASLSAEASMSRSVFSQRFTALVGQPPMTYALLWRMAVACDALRFSGRPAHSARPSPERSAGRQPDSPAIRLTPAARDMQRPSWGDAARSAREAEERGAAKRFLVGARRVGVGLPVAQLAHL